MPEEPTPPKPPDISQSDAHPDVKEVSFGASDPEILEFIKKLPPEKRERFVAVFSQKVSFSQQSLYSGPIPPASELAKYEKILPGSVDRIFKMVESQNAHRIGIEKNTISSQQHREGMGQWMAFAIAIGGIGAALYAALNGQAWFGGTLCAECLTSLVYAFVVSKKSRDDDFEKKRPPPPEKPGSPPSV